MKVISFSVRIGENVHVINIWLSLYNYYNLFLFYAYGYISVCVLLFCVRARETDICISVA